ncbi:MAG: hypothetical protein K0S95_1931 [Pantoea eucrina]|nr:hypothetical protein [Pantoea eucrina]
MRSFFKQLYRYTHSRGLRHNENLWPYLSISRAPEGHISKLFWKKREIDIKPLDSALKAATTDVTIVATGPSVRDTDFTLLNNTTFIGVNGAYELRKAIRFSFYIIVDRDFIKNRFDIVEKVISDTQLTLMLTLHCLNDLLLRKSSKDIRCGLTIIEDVSYKIYQEKVNPDDYTAVYGNYPEFDIYPASPQTGFSWDIRKGIFDAGTVAYWALQVSVWLGAKRIFLAGVDMNNFSLPRFYEDENDMQPSFLQTNFEKLIKPAFSNASKGLQERGIKVYNLSINSGLSESIFKKAELNEIF